MGRCHSAFVQLTELDQSKLTIPSNSNKCLLYYFHVNNRSIEVSQGCAYSQFFSIQNFKAYCCFIYLISDQPTKFGPILTKCFRVSVQGVKSLGGHFACLCRGFDFYDVKKNIIIFQKEKGNTFTLLIIFIVKSLQKEQNSTNLLLRPPITPK